MSEYYAGQYRGKRVLVTGHTGFKGSWLCHWLLRLGADVTGIALEPSSAPALFDQLRLRTRMEHCQGDIRDIKRVTEIITTTRPHYLFHLAAQPLVRLSYDVPVETYATNVMGTVHILEALRRSNQPCIAIMITSDKCYENREWLNSYREEDKLGGHDPYSSSKAAAEHVINAYRLSYFDLTPGIKLASVRAGNVIGGGDWAVDRIVPDCIRALQAGRAVAIRNRYATRPWQHVLEPLSGYMWLGACLSDPGLAPKWCVGGRNGADDTRLTGAFNFGPDLDSNRSVGDLVQEIFKHWRGDCIDDRGSKPLHEASKLNLSIDKAYHLIDWRPTWNFCETVDATIRWYASVHGGASAESITNEQIDIYSAAAKRKGLRWT